MSFDLMMAILSSNGTMVEYAQASCWRGSQTWRVSRGSQGGSFLKTSTVTQLSELASCVTDLDLILSVRQLEFTSYAGLQIQKNYSHSRHQLECFSHDQPLWRRIPHLESCDPFVILTRPIACVQFPVCVFGCMVLLKFAFVLWSFANDSLPSLILPFSHYNILTCDVTEICLSTNQKFLFLLNMGKQKFELLL